MLRDQKTAPEASVSREGDEIALRCGLNLPHDCVSVQVAGSQGKHDLERSGGQRIKFSSWHSYSMIDISMNDCSSA
jgi:hypothetical protein